MLRCAEKQLDTLEAAQPCPAEPVTVHCPNTGPMTGLLDMLRAPVYLSVSKNAKRKHAHSLEMIQPSIGGAWVGVHSANANAVVASMLQQCVWLPQKPPPPKRGHVSCPGFPGTLFALSAPNAVALCTLRQQAQVDASGSREPFVFRSACHAIHRWSAPAWGWECVVPERLRCQLLQGAS
jgi:SfsA N-terminal OB domain